jgi:Immunoglobulin I-set domain
MNRTGCRHICIYDNQLLLHFAALQKEPVKPVIAPQPSGPQTHEVTIQFGQTSTTTTTVTQGGPQLPEMPPGPLSAPCSVLPLYPDYYDGPVGNEEEPPRFTLPLRNQTVNDGDRAVLRVFFRGTPMPTVTWYFNSQPVRPGQDFQIDVDNVRGESTLVIVEVFPEDEGEYMCKAENPLGTAITHCHLFVRSE